jgi:hypothetical protein
LHLIKSAMPDADFSDFLKSMKKSGNAIGNEQVKYI